MTNKEWAFATLDAYRSSRHAPDELKAALIERNLTNELKILGCVRD